VLLAPAEDVMAETASIPLDELKMTDQLRRLIKATVDELQRKIVSELQGRAAFAVAGMLLVMLGAALGVVFRSGHALVAFGVAAVPGLLTILAILLGKQVAESNASHLQQLGVVFIWAGNIVIAGVTAFFYGKLMKH
jgi:lipopolysaccharide export LptBFGC system permease protein LptF